MSSNVGQILPPTPELSALESKKLMYYVVNTPAPSFLIGCSSILHITRTTIKSEMSLKFGQIRPWTAELAALECLKKSFTYLRTMQNIFMT